MAEQHVLEGLLGRQSQRMFKPTKDNMTTPQSHENGNQ